MPTKTQEFWHKHKHLSRHQDQRLGLVEHSSLANESAEVRVRVEQGQEGMELGVRVHKAELEEEVDLAMYT